MAYRLEPNEELSAGLKRIAREQLDQAIENATSADRDRDVAVHEVRKGMKKLRAVLRLARDELGQKVYRKENACYRGAARRLSGLRETAVLVATVEKLQSDFAGEPGSAALDSLLVNLQGQKNALQEQELDRKNALADAAEALREAGARVEGWPLKSRGFSAVDKGVRRVYRRGRTGLRLVQKAPTDGNFHEWRKSVKYLWYHARLLEAAWPALMGALIAELDVLGDALGAEHDLSDLRAVLSERPELAGGESTLDPVMGLIGRRQEELRSGALPLGARVYAERPGAFVGRLHAYWGTAESR